MHRLRVGRILPRYLKRQLHALYRQARLVALPWVSTFFASCGCELPSTISTGAHMFRFIATATRCSYGTGTLAAIGALYKDGGGGIAGISRFYRGLVPALMQGPLSRFGDTVKAP